MDIIDQIKAHFGIERASLILTHYDSFTVTDTDGAEVETIEMSEVLPGVWAGYGEKSNVLLVRKW